MNQMIEIKNQLQGKRLLLLGGNILKDAIQKVAEEYGIILIAVGNNPLTDLFSVAQETYVVDSTDADAMKKLIVEKKIDGVYMGGAEPVIAAACVFLKDLGFPCYCTKEQWNLLQDKTCFKKLCVQYGLPIVPHYNINEEDIPNFTDFPVMTKPTNSSGSRGFSVCRNVGELNNGYIKAKENSYTGEVIVEKFVKNDAVCVCYTVCDGRLYFSGLEDKYSILYKEQQSYVGGLFVFESSLADDFRERFESKIASFVSDFGIREGNFWFEVFLDDGNYYFNEAGYRAGGSATAYPIDYMYGINQVAADIYYALTGKGVIDGFVSIIPERVPRKKKYAVYSVFAKGGTVFNIKGAEKLRANQNIVYVIEKKHIGDSVQETGNFSQIVALVHFVFDTEEECKQTIEDIRETFQMIDQNGRNMICNLLDIETIKLR